ncbi:MAG: hypothetical protein JKY37_31295 [Nannocystaceae bacterium]|nr:hypothetical protein [Nannocystaceae bacterium]
MHLVSCTSASSGALRLLLCFLPACAGTADGKDTGETDSVDSTTSGSDDDATGGGSGPGSATSTAASSWGPATGDDDTDTSGSSGDESGSTSTGEESECPHPLYPSLDLCALPGDGGGFCGAYESPILPTTTRTVTIQSAGSQAADDLLDACSTPGTAVDVPNSAGHIPVITLGGVDDCDVSLGDAVTTDTLVIGGLAGPVLAPSHRLRIRGGKIATVAINEETTDVTFDGTVIDNGFRPTAERVNKGIVLYSGDGPDSVVNRFAIVNSIIRAVEGPVDPDGSTHGFAYIGSRARNVLFANNNIVTAGNHDSWGFRIGGGCNALIVDNTVRVSFHKFIRFNDADTDYAYVRGGIWMREATVSPEGINLSDTFTELQGDHSTDHIYIHDPEIYMLATGPLSFGAAPNAGNAGHSWEVRSIEWHATSPTIVNDEVLGQFAQYCVAGADCDYGIGSHTYTYDPELALPEDPWRQLPTVSPSNPDELPITP